MKYGNFAAVFQLYPRLCRGLYRAYRRGYICPLGRLYFLPFGQKVNVCAPCAHILITRCHRGDSERSTASVRPIYKNVPPVAALLNFAAYGSKT